MRFFEKSKYLFNASDLADLKSKFDIYIAVDKSQNRGYDFWHYNILPLESVFKIDEVGSIA